MGGAEGFGASGGVISAEGGVAIWATEFDAWSGVVAEGEELGEASKAGGLVGVVSEADEGIWIGPA